MLDSKIPSLTSAHLDEFDPADVRIERHRLSTTQGEVSVYYRGEKIERYGDRIEMNGAGEWVGRPDSVWIEAARRFCETRKRAAPASAVEAVIKAFPRSTYVSRHAENLAHLAAIGAATLRASYPNVVFVQRNADKLAAAVASVAVSA
jgi:hypothetical protein